MRWLAMVVSLFLVPCSLSGQTYAPHLFATGPQFVAGLIQASDGNFYGVTADSVVQITPAATVNTLHQLVGEGTMETGLVEGRDGWLYGATTTTIYRISLAGEFQILTTQSVALPMSAFVPASDGNFYLPAEGYAPQSPGNVYRYNPAENTFTAIGLTTATAGVLQAADGYLYVTTVFDGIYRMQVDGTGEENFAGTGTGTGPENGIVEGPNAIAYGLTTFSGAYGYGDFYKVSADGTSSSLFSLQGGFSEPNTVLYLASDGTYFGFGTGYRSEVEPTVPASMFRFDPETDTLQTVVTDPFINGGAPNFGPLIGGADGRLYGTVLITGAEGAVYTIAADPPMPPAVQVSAPATIIAGQSATATFQVLNAFSLSAQQCNAFATPAGGTAIALGPVHGELQGNVYTGSFQGSTPVPGNYLLAVNCGGVESGFANVMVEAAN